MTINCTLIRNLPWICSHLCLNLSKLNINIVLSFFFSKVLYAKLLSVQDFGDGGCSSTSTTGYKTPVTCGRLCRTVLKPVLTALILVKHVVLTFCCIVLRESRSCWNLHFVIVYYCAAYFTSFNKRFSSLMLHAFVIPLCHTGRFNIFWVVTLWQSLFQVLFW